MTSPVSFWSLPIGTLFFTTWNDHTKVKRPFQKVSECEFSRPFAKRRWMMFRPDGVCVNDQKVIPTEEVR